MAKRKKLGDIGQVVPDAVTGVERGVQSLVLPDSSSGSRRKKSATSRIGRACDRCQHRKLACDPSPEGCPPCQRVNAWCTVTDPLTGTPTYRGEFEYLEYQVSKQNREIKELVAKLKALGEDVSPYEEETERDRKYQLWMQVKASGDTRPWDRDEKQLNVSRHLGSHPIPNGAAMASGNLGPVASELPLPLDAPGNSGALKLPDLRTGLAQPNPYKYVGIALQDIGSGAEPSLNILGWQLNLAAFSGTPEANIVPPSKGEPVYDRSYYSFMATAFGAQQRIAKPEMPPKEDALQLVDAFIMVVEPFAPIFYAPTLREIANRFYDDPDGLSLAAQVCIRTIIAIMFYQTAMRNHEDRQKSEYLRALTDQHYHYALSFFPQLLMGTTLQDMQALAILSLHVRSFPTPEIGWLCATLTFNKLIQLNYHRSVKSSLRRQGRSFRELETQKRVFWSMLVILVTASGKLGRPMPIRLEDFDVEPSLPVSDDQLLESLVDTQKPGHCMILVGIEGHKVAPIYLELYNVMYATKRSSKEYMQFVGVAERRIKAWEDQWPPQYQQNPETADPLSRICIYYLNFWSLEFRLLLHHPSLSLTKSFQFNDANLKACMEASRNMLRTVRSLQMLKSLDPTWYNCAVYMLAIQTTFYGHGQLKDDLTKEKLEELRSDMDSWLSIMADIGILLGSGRRLHDTVSHQIKIGLGQLENHLESKIAAQETKPEPPAVDAETKELKPESVDHAPVMDHQLAINDATTYESYANPPQSAGGYTEPQHFPQSAGPQSANSFTGQVPSYAYAQPANNNFGAQHGGYGQQFNQNIPVQTITSPYAQQHHHAHAPSTGSVGTIYNNSGPQYAPNHQYTADSDSWYHYTQTLPVQEAVQPQAGDFQPAANALLALSDPSNQNIGLSSMPQNYETSGIEHGGMTGGQGIIWPMEVMSDNHPPHQ